MYDELAKKLKDNTEVMESTFRSKNLQVESFNIRADSDGSCKFIVEIVGGRLRESVEVKVNLYTDDGDIYSMESGYLNESFSGFDTILVYFSEEETIDKVVKARIYAVGY